jgi:hypothetical protein
MSRASLAVVSCVALLLLAAHVAAQDHVERATLFNGSSLEGWQPEGGATWEVRGGEIVGAAAEGGPGRLVLGRGYQDFVLTLAFRCDGCEAGVLLRRAPLASGNTSAILAAIAGPDAGTAYRVTMSADGKELNRTQLHKFVGRERLPYMSMSITTRDDGWSDLRIQLRGDAEPDDEEGEEGEGDAEPRQTSEERVGIFGPLALLVARGEARYRDVALEDLTRPAAGLIAEVTADEFEKVLLTDRFYAEGIAAGDVNRDGATDIVTGPFAYLGPKYQRAQEIYPPMTYSIAGEGQHGQYTDSFLTYVHDFDADGWPDVLKVNFDGAFLYVNPQRESRHWTEHKVVDSVSAETTQLGDVDGDDKLEFIMSTGRGDERVIAFAKPDASDPTKPWKLYRVSAKGDWGGHAMGYGDINGDGRVDILQGSGWWEQPAGGATQGEWTFHKVPFGRGTDPFVRGADMFAYDLNGDDLPDVITSLFAHGPGLVWYEQQRDAQGAITWKEHVIMDAPSTPPDERQSWETTDKSVAFTELHALALVDMNGDGTKDIVTGKRWWSHGMEYSENDLDDPAVLYWFEIVRKPGGQVAFTPHLINNYVGLGTQIAAADVNDDGKADVLTAARKGAFVFLNNLPGGTKPTAARNPGL